MDDPSDLIWAWAIVQSTLLVIVPTSVDCHWIDRRLAMSTLRRKVFACLLALVVLVPLYFYVTRSRTLSLRGGGIYEGACITAAKPYHIYGARLCRTLECLHNSHNLSRSCRTLECLHNSHNLSRSCRFPPPRSIVRGADQGAQRVSRHAPVNCGSSL